MPRAAKPAAPSSCTSPSSAARLPVPLACFAADRFGASRAPASLATIATRSLVQQPVEIAAMIEYGDDPDLLLLDAIDNAIRQDDQLAVHRDPSSAELRDD